MNINEAGSGQPVPEDSFLRRYIFQLDEFQLKAISRIQLGESVMVAAPTSAGKTVVAEYALWRMVNEGKKAIYTTPIKALSNQKRRDLELLFPGEVGLLTGDRSENKNASVIVMTTEILRNMLLEDPGSLTTVGCIVFDEIHYLADKDRGTIWEECIITSLPNTQLICLSATIANAREIADWIGQTHRPVALIRHDERPVPLEHYGFSGGALRLVRDAAGRRAGSIPDYPAKRRRQPTRPRPDEVVRALQKAELLPAIWFAFARHGVEVDAEICAAASPEVAGESRAKIETAIAWTLALLPAEDRSLLQIERLLRLLRHGVGFHHAGLLPPCKELVEDLFLRGLLSVVCATDTLSVGINMPARTVVISSMSRPVGGLLTANDFSQLTGRAGRRGIDERGAVVILPTAYHSFERSYALINGDLEPIRSSFTLRYSTFLSMFRGEYPEDRLATLVRSSLRQFQLAREARTAEAKLLALTADLEMLPPLHMLQGREEELDEYLELQRRQTAAERPRSPEQAQRSHRKSETRGKRKARRDSNEIKLLRTLLENHPMHRVASSPSFQSVAVKHLGLLGERNRLLRIIEESKRVTELDADTAAKVVRAVLKRLGYVDRNGLRHKASGLREIVAPSGLVLSEMYHEGMLGDLIPAHLAELVSWFACDVDRHRYNSFRLPEDLIRLRGLADLVFNRVSGLEERQGIRLSTGASGWFWGAALAWCRGDALEAISARLELGDGDIISILNQTVDLLDQLRGLLTRYGDHDLLNTTDEARRLLCRGLVAMIRNDVPVETDDYVPAQVAG